MTRRATPPIHFFKMTGTGNDFIVIDNRNGLIDSDRCQDLVRAACRRKLSVGADGVILIENDPEVDFKWRFFNADASEAEMCGNGARCAARFAHHNGIVAKTQMAFRTLAGIIKAELLGDRIKVQMTLPHSLQRDLHLTANGQSFDLDFLNTGVPHVAYYAKDEEKLEMLDIAGVGRAVRFHPRFQPEGTNVNFVYVGDAHHLTLRTYERGVEGETLACGTGAIASTLISAARELVVSPVEVTTRSSETLMIYFEMVRTGQSRNDIRFKDVFLEGEARIVYEADLWSETLSL